MKMSGGRVVRLEQHVPKNLRAQEETEVLQSRVFIILQYDEVREVESILLIMNKIN